MKTITACVQEILVRQPYLEEALSRQIINYSALANELIKPISDTLGRPIKVGAIMMALRRHQAPNIDGNNSKLKKVLRNLGDITVRSHLSDFTFQNSDTLPHSHAKILDQMGNNPHVFYAFTRGIYESNIIISSSQKTAVQDSFKNEILIAEKKHLSAITLTLPPHNSKVVGLYYHIFKRLAWEGIAIYEVVSTTNEFTIMVEDAIVDRAFLVIKALQY